MATLLVGFRVRNSLLCHVEEKSEIILLFFCSFTTRIISVLEIAILGQKKP